MKKNNKTKWQEVKWADLSIEIKPTKKEIKQGRKITTIVLIGLSKSLNKFVRRRVKKILRDKELANRENPYLSKKVKKKLMKLNSKSQNQWFLIFLFYQQT